MAEHPIENVMKTTMENLKEMIDVNTIVGDAVETAEGTVIVPISKVSFGFVAGGGEYKENGAAKKATIMEMEGLPTERKMKCPLQEAAVPAFRLIQ